MSRNDKDSVKVEKLRAAVKDRVDKEEHAFRLVEKMVLLDSVDKEFFLNAGKYITASQYNDVTEERAITKLCGYPLCGNRITQVLKQKYKISVSEKKVYDITERKNFCSNQCYKASKYFQSQLSAEPVWMREKTKSHELKLLHDAERLAKKLSGSGEEVVMNAGRNDDEQEHVDDGNKHGHDEHEIDDSENEDDDNEHEDVDNEHEYDNIHNRIRFDTNADLGYVVERLGNVKIDLNIDLSDSDDDVDIDDAIDNIDDDHYGDNEENKHCNKDKITQNSEKCVYDNSKSAKMKMSLSNSQGQTIKDIDSNNESSNQSKNRRTNLHNVEKPKVSFFKRSCNSLTNSDPEYTDQLNQNLDQKCKTANLTKKGICTNDSETALTMRDNECKRGGSKNTHTSVYVLDGGKSSECSEQARKQCVDEVYKVLLEWSSTETRAHIRTSLRKRESAFDDLKGSDKTKEERTERKYNRQSVTLPSIDSKNQMAIRGGIVSEKLTKAMSPMLAKLSLTKADISSQLTCLLKTFRFTNTNIVLKPSEWTLVALILLLALVKYNPSLNELLSSRQKDLHSLLSNTVDDEDDVDRLLGVFDFENCSEPAIGDGQQQYDVEELD